MINSETLENLIRRYIQLGKRSAKGYEIVNCAVCNDYQPRGGFKFDGESVHYQCFNCGTSTGYDPSLTRHSISKKFKHVLLSFGIPEDEIKKCISFNFFRKEEVVKKDDSQKRIVGYPITACPLPEKSVKVSSRESIWCTVAEEYLASRSIKVEDFEFYVSDSSKFAGRLLIPYFFRGKIIYWQGRSMDDETISPRYKNPVVEKENIFFNMDEIYRYTTDPLFVTEGPLDAISIGSNAIALSGSTLTEFKITELKRAAARRRVVFVIDKNKNGLKLGSEILSHEEENFYVTCFPDNIEDSNDALQKLGRLWVASHLVTTARSGFSGKLLLELYCSK